MRAGAMRYQITITSAAAQQDSYGQPSTAPGTAVLTTWASIAAATGKEIYALGAGFTSQVTHKIVIRFPDVAITAGMMVQFQPTGAPARIFRIQAVSDPTERRRELDLMVLEESK